MLDWSVWSRAEHPSILEEVRNPTSRCTVVDLGSLETVEEQHLVAEAVLSALWATRAQREPCLVVIDEAHNICAAEPADPVSRIATDRAVQIAAEGRKYGLYLLVSTQRPNKVHENVVSQCDNLLMMRMNSHADLADLGRLFSFVPPGCWPGPRRSGWARCSWRAGSSPRAATCRWGRGSRRRAAPTFHSRGRASTTADRPGGSRPEAVRSRLHPQRMRSAVARGVGFRPRRDRTQ